jgi:hypothetical protein
MLEVSAQPGSYVTLTRNWRAGDRIEMELPMHLAAQALADDPGLQAFLYGPLVLTGDLGNEGLPEGHIIGPNLRVGAPNVEQYGYRSARRIGRRLFPISRSRGFGRGGRRPTSGSSRPTVR